MNPAVILMAYGSPDRLSDVPAYYADIRGGRSIAPEQLDDLVARYRALGIGENDGPSPLNAVTEETRAALAAALGLPVFTGMRHWTPRIGDAVEAAIASGHDLLVGLVLAPHWSSLSIEKYRRLFDDAVAGRVESRFVERWGADPAFVAVLADRVRGTATHVVFTAHSLPARILGDGDPYRDELLETARLVAEQAGIDAWSFSFQSESPTGEHGSARTVSTTSRRCDRAASTTSSSARWGLSPTTSRSAGTSTTRQRSARPSSACGSSGSRCRTPILRSSTCSRGSCALSYRR